MNKSRRARIQEQISEIENSIHGIIDAADNLDTISNEVSGIKEEEDEAFNNLSDSLQESDKGQKMEYAVDTLDVIENTLESISSKLNSISGDLGMVNKKLVEVMK